MGCRLALEVTLSSGNELLIGIISLLVVLTLVAAGSDHDLLGLPLWPPVAAFGTPLCTLADCLEGRLPVALDKNSPDRLLARGMPSGDIAAELMHQGSAVRVRPECQDDIGITDLGELVALLRELLNVIP
jgi:hypothetical protein